MRWTAGEIATAVDGTVDDVGREVVVDRVTQDSREIDPTIGSWLFVPLRAERDGHDYVPAAVAAGAVATLASQSVDAAGAAVIEVANTSDALAHLGAAGRRRLDEAVVVGITGSVGKTTTKDLLAAVFAADRPTHASTRSFNNEIGVPLTLLAAPDDVGAVVVEMGARGIGHIRWLCEIAQPTVGIVTTVGLAHTSEFGSVASVAEGKGELIEALPSASAGGVAVLNGDVPLVAAMADRTTARVITFGRSGDVRAEDVALSDDLVPSFRLVSPWGSVDVRLGARGLHLIDNALAAAGAALACGVGLDTLADALGAPVLSPNRMAVGRAATGATLLDDTYNANPLSVSGALRSLARLPARHRIAVLGVMAELGASSAVEHERMARLAVGLGIEVVAVAAPEYGTEVSHVDGWEAARERLAGLGPDDAVLVKGSRVAGLERLVQALA